VRHGYFALYCLESRDTALSSRDTALSSRDTALSSRDTALSSRGLTAGSIPLSEFSKKYDTPAKILDGFRNADPKVFFEIIVKRMDPAGKTGRDDTKLPRDSIFFPPKGNSLSEKLLYHSIPLWFEKSIEKRMKVSNWTSTELDTFLSQQDFRPPLWIRINHTEHTKAILDELHAENFQTEIFDSSIKVTGAKGIFILPAFQKGWFEIQDLASQQIGEHVQAKPGQYVWDCCAGGGGKTMQIASRLKNKGVIYASDIRAYKLLEIKKRSKKAQFFNIRCIEWDGTKNSNSFPKEIQNHGGFDWILVDAPCSSTGTWRRNPDAKYRVNQSELENLLSLQLSILQQASTSVAKNGHLVYSTCSFLTEENEGIVEEFLQKNPSFELVKNNILGNPKEDADTMFACVLRKN
jgi:16S rRNA (cytosine967-C5)-methyltransferase